MTVSLQSRWGPFYSLAHALGRDEGMGRNTDILFHLACV